MLSYLFLIRKRHGIRIHFLSPAFYKTKTTLLIWPAGLFDFLVILAKQKMAVNYCQS